MKELEDALGVCAAASFKHVSPAGAAIAEPLTPELEEAYEVQGKALTPQALAYIRARNADPMSRYAVIGRLWPRKRGLCGTAATCGC